MPKVRRRAIDMIVLDRCRRTSYFDSFTIPTERDQQVLPGYFMLFGNRNVGNVLRSNMQCAGALGSGREFYVENWYARTDFTGSLEARADFERWAKWVNVTLTVGDQPCGWTTTLDELLRGRPWIPDERLDQMPTEEEADEIERRRQEGLIPVEIPQRQNFGVTILHAAQHWEPLEARYRLKELEPATIWVRLEGIEVRERY